MKIEVGKTYITRCKDKVKIIYTDRECERQIIGLINNVEIIEFTKSGRYYNDGSESGLDLIEEYRFWSDVEVDTRIYVKDSDNGTWIPRHFANYIAGGVYTWANGGTSFTAGNVCYTHWRYAKLAKDK